MGNECNCLSCVLKCLKCGSENVEAATVHETVFKRGETEGEVVFSLNYMEVHVVCGECGYKSTEEDQTVEGTFALLQQATQILQVPFSGVGTRGDEKEGKHTTTNFELNFLPPAPEK